MWAGIKKFALGITMVLLSVACISINRTRVTNALESTNRNEQYAPSAYNVSVSSTSGYTKLFENKNFEYYYSGEKTILKIVNKKTGFVWSTGADTEKKKAQLTRCSGISKYSAEYYACTIDTGPLGNGSDNDSGYAEINGLVYFTFLDERTAFSSTTVALTPKVSTALFGHNTYANMWMFKMSYETGSHEFKINLRFNFTEEGFDLRILDSDVYGKSRDCIEAIYPLPRLGQSGGKMIQCRIDDEDGDGYGDCHFDDMSTIIDNPRTNLDGYIFVPDGSGALIRFDNIKYYDANGVYFDMYKDPYREKFTDYEFGNSLSTLEPDYVPTKHISMPVWGVAYGENQDAFVAYVTEGSEYFGLLYKGRTTKFEYASIQPRFERNRSYQFQFGTSKTNLILEDDELYRYNAGITYNFLSGDGSDGSYPANYVGMALKYREYLQTNNLVKSLPENDLKVGPKVDFLICDVKEGLFGYSEVNVTNFNDVENILTELKGDGINDITSTLYGWQDGGMSTARPWETKYNKNAGGKIGLKSTIQTAAELGYSINLYEQYAMINEIQTKSFNAYAVKALSRDYGAYQLSDTNKPITWWAYANADQAGNWLVGQAEEISKLGDNVGITTGGISTLLVPDYGKKLLYKDAANSYYQSTKIAAEQLPLSGDTPNAYLWKNYDSFYNLSVYNSQYQCETDSVPFMEIVFSGIVNLYAEYANFSFYDKISQLKMIDYNLNPSFIITKEEKEDVMYTNARDWFSTGYDNYHVIINEICDTVLPILKLTQGKTMINREVVEFDNKALGLYVNTYATVNNGVIGNDKTVIAINYFDYPVSYNYNGQTIQVPALSAVELN